MLRFGSGECDGVVGAKGGWDEGVEGTKVVKDVPETVHVLGCEECGDVLCLPRGCSDEFLAF